MWSRVAGCRAPVDDPLRSPAGTDVTDPQEAGAISYEVPKKGQTRRRLTTVRVDSRICGLEMSGAVKSKLMIDPQRTIAELKELRALTADENGAQRVAWTDTWLKARAWFESKLQGLPVEHHLDAAGNRWVTLQGASDKALLLGSHLDSVPNGGWLDGPLGVLAALEVLRRFAREFDGRPPITIRLVDFADEEGARFGRSLLGSSAFAGTHSIEADRVRTDKDGIRLEDALRRCGVEIERFDEARREQKNAAAYLELHIEQGPVLESLGLQLGVVLGTKGVERHTVTFHGQEAHSGSTPMHARRDALAAAAKLALEIRSIAAKHPDAVCTIGSLKTFPGIVTAVVGRCEVALDQRDLDANVVAAMWRAAQEASQRFASEEKCTVEWSRIWSIEPLPFHPELIARCEQAIIETAGVAHRLPSGPLHDAAEVGRSGIPATMMFVQSLGGISHNKIEDTKEEHIEQALVAFDKLAAKTAEWISAA
jgi:N-carbamoyl-L-amino-acid hydrolase